MKKYLVLLVMFLAACGDNGAKTDVVADVDNTEGVIENNAGESNDVIKLGKDDNGSEITVKVGQEVELEFEANATTGYSWQYATYVLEDNAVEEVAEEYIPNEHSEGMVGVGGKSLYRIKTLKPGTVYIAANYSREAINYDDQTRENDFIVKVVIE